MANILYLIFFMSIIFLAEASTCSIDLNFTVSAWKVKSEWLTKTSVQYGVRDGLNKISSEFYNSPNEVSGFTSSQQYPVRVDVKDCGEDCDGYPYVKISVSTRHKAEPSSHPPKVVSGYDYFPGLGFYRYNRDVKTWDQARKICEEEGGHIVIINSEDESKILQDYMAQTPHFENADHNDFAIIGFHDRFVEAEYMTIFGKPLGSTRFTKWAPYQPDNNEGNENCGSVHRTGGLNDIPCTWRLPFFCEQELD